MNGYVGSESTQNALNMSKESVQNALNMSKESVQNALNGSLGSESIQML